ncbi:DUF6531 domain-containing protein [Pseudomonas aeruginosa]
MRIKESLLVPGKLLSVSCLMLALFFSQGARAEYYYWYLSSHGKQVSSPSAGCDIYFSSISKDPGRVFVMEPSSNSPGKTFYCVVRAVSTGRAIWTTDVYLKGDSCPLGAELNIETGTCDCRPGYEMDDIGCKLPDKNGPDKGPPPPEGCAGNPVNITNGNKYQVESDLSIPIPLNRYYNGLDGLWRHSYSARITRKDDGFLLYRENGKASEFTGSGKDLTSITDVGRLSRLPGRFIYTSELNEVMEFDQSGKLTKLTTKEGRKYRVERGASLTISDEHGNKLVLSEGTNHQLLRAQQGVYPLSTHTTRNSDSLR